jgi:four helix bundle protein
VERRSRGARERGSGGARVIQSHEELEVYKMAFEAAMRIFELTKRFPKEETYSLTDQIRRSSRSVCSNIAEAWRKRRYEAAFVSKLNDSEAEAAETQTWLQFAVECGYLSAKVGEELRQTYDHIIGKLVNMIVNPHPWLMLRSNR